MLLHRLGGIGDRAVEIDGEPLERNRPRDVAQIVEHPLDDHHLALDRPLERLAVLRVLEHLLNQLAAVADVLDRMRQVVDQPRGDAAEHRLAFLLSDLFLQLDEPVGHRVERIAELTDFVLAGQRDALSMRPSAIARVTRVSAKMRWMNDRPHTQPRIDRAEQRQADRRQQLPSRRAAVAERFAVGCSTTTVHCGSVDPRRGRRNISAPLSSRYSGDRDLVLANRPRT